MTFSISLKKDKKIFIFAAICYSSKITRQLTLRNYFKMCEKYIFIKVKLRSHAREQRRISVLYWSMEHRLFTTGRTIFLENVPSEMAQRYLCTLIGFDYNVSKFFSVLSCFDIYFHKY